MFYVYIEDDNEFDVTTASLTDDMMQGVCSYIDVAITMVCAPSYVEFNNVPPPPAGAPVGAPPPAGVPPPPAEVPVGAPLPPAGVPLLPAGVPSVIYNLDAFGCQKVCMV